MSETDSSADRGYSRTMPLPGTALPNFFAEPRGRSTMQLLVSVNLISHRVGIWQLRYQT